METKINDVSDTALWVAHYRAVESKRSDALFHDTLAEKLIGERGKAIAEYMTEASPYTEWTIIIRTVIIDKFIQELVTAGIDTVINLGAGMDTRPYRMNLPSHLRWIEVDYANIINHKNKILANETPKCQLERVVVDLSDNQKRQEFFKQAASQTKKAVILTEGVIPYLSEEQVGQLADDLHAQKSFVYWIAEYLSPLVYDSIRSKTRAQKMKNAPFLFFPKEWMQFFAKHGWVSKETRYMIAEAQRQKRRFPAPWYGIFIYMLSSAKKKKQLQEMSGFVLFEKN